MFVIIRHAAYDLGTGALTAQGLAETQALGQRLLNQADAWVQIRTSSIIRSYQTAEALAQILHLPLEVDERLINASEPSPLLPPTVPPGIIFVSHLPLLARALRAWSNLWLQEEPPLLEVGHGYIIRVDERRISAI